MAGNGAPIGVCEGEGHCVEDTEPAELALDLGDELWLEGDGDLDFLRRRRVFEWAL